MVAHVNHRLATVLALTLALAAPALAQPPRIAGSPRDHGPPGTLLIGERLDTFDEEAEGRTLLRRIALTR